LAIAAFVLALLGFLGCTAVLAIALGIAGIAVTRGGRRRGMGLAIASIPIALVTGTISVLAALLIYDMAVGLLRLPERVQPLFAAGDFGDGRIERFRDLASESLNAKVSDAQVEAWLQRVREKHGTVVKTDTPTQGNTAGAKDPAAILRIPAQFVNGAATIQLEMKPEQLLTDQEIDGIDVGGISLLAVAAESEKAGAAETEKPSGTEQPTKPPDNGSP